MKTQWIARSIAVAALAVAIPTAAEAQSPAVDPPAAVQPAQPPQLFVPGGQPTPRFEAGPSNSATRVGRMTPAEIRQARALYRAQQRTARLEYNLWMGYEPLRPNWNAVPMMSSRYGNRRVYVPLYVHTR